MSHRWIIGRAALAVMMSLSWAVAASPTRIADAAPASAVCFAEHDGDGVTDFSSSDAQAVRDAIAAVGAGGVVKLAGTCAGVSGDALATIDKSLTLRGGYAATDWLSEPDAGANPTTLDAVGGGRVISATAAVTIENLIVQNGVAVGHGGGIYAGNGVAVLNSTLISNTSTLKGGGLANQAGELLLDGVRFEHNAAVQSGGGAWTYQTSMISNSTFFSNTAGGAGGGLYQRQSAVIIATRFEDNFSVSHGGGVYAEREVVSIRDSAFVGNRANGGDGGGIDAAAQAFITGTVFLNNFSNPGSDGGGGAYFQDFSSLKDVVFQSNSSTIDGGGAYFYWGGTVAENVRFIGNSATRRGGAVHIWDSYPISLQRSRLLHNSANTGAGISMREAYSDADVELTNNVFAGNAVVSPTGGADIWAAGIDGVKYVVRGAQNTFVAASGVYTSIVVGAGVEDDSATLTNTIFSGYAAAGHGISSAGVTFIGVLSDSVGALHVGAGSASSVVDGSAEFLDPAGDFYIALGSALDNGVDSGVAVDIQGNARPHNVYDLGAYEVGDEMGSAALRDLLIYPGAFSPTFSGTVTTYAITVPNANASATLTPTLGTDGQYYTITASPGACSGPHDVASCSLAVGVNVITVTVASPNRQNTREYVLTMTRPAALVCFAETTGDGVTDFSSSDAQAVRDAVAAASAGGVVKIAGTCAGASSGAVATIDKELTLRGGYTTTDWTTSDAAANPTVLDAQGGGHVVNASTAVTVENLMVQNGVGASMGGGVNAQVSAYVSNTVFYSNTATGGGSMGGGLYAAKAMTVVNATFERNSAVYGGGLYANKTAQVNGTQFLTNTATKGGGGTYIYGEAHLVNTDFISNTAAGGNVYGGGALLMAGGSVEGGRFERNTADYEGGGLYVAMDVDFEISGTQFLSNATGGWGGGAYVEYDGYDLKTLYLTNTEWVSNTAASGGGGLYAPYYTQLWVKDSRFVRNMVTDTGSRGGGLYSDAYFDEDSRIADTVFEENTAVSDGGGLYVAYGNDMPLELIAVTFLTNTSGGKGGGAYLDVGTMVSGSTFTSNTAANDGGALYMTNASTIESSRFEKNVGSLGGAALIAAGSTVSGTTFTSNAASGDGGALYGSSGETPITVTESTFESNRTDSTGGAMATMGPLTIQASTFTSNTAPTGWGGALYPSQKLVVSDSTFIANVSGSGSGGAIAVNDVEVSGSRFERNTATEEGGAIGAYGVTRISKSVFVDNTAPKGQAYVGNAAYFENNVIVGMEGTTGIYVAGDGAVATLDAQHMTLVGTGTAVLAGGKNQADRATLTNTIVAGSAVGVAAGGTSSIALNGVLWDNVTTPTSGAASASAQVTGAAGFVDAAGGNYLAKGAGVDAGVDSGVAEDIRGVARPQGSAYDLGAYETSADAGALDDTSLRDLTIAPGRLTPAFVSTTTKYAAGVPNGTTSMSLAASANDVGATVTVASSAGACDGSSCAVAAPKTWITVTVTAVNGDVREYVIEVTVAAPLTTIDRVWPGTGLPEGGMPVRIFGTGFSVVLTVTVDGASMPFTIENDGRIAFVMPPGVAGQSVSVTVQTADSSQTASDAFTYVQPQMIEFDGQTGGVFTTTDGVVVDIPAQGVDGMFVITMTPLPPAPGVPGSVLMYSFRLDALLNWVPLASLTNPVTIRLPIDEDIFAIQDGERPWLYQWTADGGRPTAAKTTDDGRRTTAGVDRTADSSETSVVRRPSSVVGFWTLVRGQTYDSGAQVMTVALKPMGVYAISTAYLRAYYLPVVPVAR